MDTRCAKIGEKPFYEEEGKPFKSRWPEGMCIAVEDKNPFNNNVITRLALIPIPGSRITKPLCMPVCSVLSQEAELTWTPST